LTFVLPTDQFLAVGLANGFARQTELRRLSAPSERRLERVGLGVHCEHGVLLDGATFVLLMALPLPPIRHELEKSGE
jgi:hypothetical protein